LCNNPFVAVVWVLLASALFGTTGTARALGLAATDPVVTGALRLAIGGVLLGGIAAVGLRARRIEPPPAARTGAGRLLLLVALGTAGVVAYQPTFFTGVRANGVAVGTLVALGSAPIFTGLLGWAFLRRRPDARWGGCTALAVAGVVLLSGLLGGASGGSLSAGGFLASLAAGLSYAVYTLVTKALLDLGWSTVAAVGAVFGGAGIVGVVQLLTVGGAPVTGPGLAAAAWLGIMTIAAAYLLFARGLERLPAATVATLTLTEPIVAAVLGVLVLGERIAPSGIAGAALLLIALGLLGLPRPLRLRAVAPVADAP
jgi:DME family drug/metabolite transporter